VLLELGVRALFAGAAVSALRLARSGLAPSHRPVAFLLGGLLLADLARAPALGLPLLARRALYLAFPLLSAWASLEVGLLARTRWHGAARVPIALLWALLVAFVAWCADPRGSPQHEALARAVHHAALLVEILAAGAVVTRAVRELRPPDISATVILLLTAGDIGEVAGAWIHHGQVRDFWHLARVSWAAVYGISWYLQERRRAWLERVMSTRARVPSRWVWGRPSRWLRRS
jgi:hypothetical protein